MKITKKKINTIFARVECFLFSHNWQNFSTFTTKSHNLNTGQRFCKNCGKMQFKTKITVSEKILKYINKLNS